MKLVCEMNDTIVAQATAGGKAAIAVIRVSGSDTFRVMQKVMLPQDIEKLQHRKAVIANLYHPAKGSSQPEFLDQCIVLTFVAPHSYTGEDLVEIQCHGGFVVPHLLAEALIAAGARYAQAGEFTQRAFLNGKLDLVQAESVEAIVSASSRSELKLVHHHYSGHFSTEVKRLRSELIDLLSLLELELDFAEEDVEFADREEILSRLNSLRDLLSGLFHSYERSHLVRQGVRVAIVGKPNVGKSSLLNLLLKKERAIVTDHPGTTRDIIEEAMEIAGLKFVFIDTAGIRSTEDYVESLGIQRSQSVLANADLVLMLIDHSEQLKKEDWEIRQLVLNRKKHSVAQPILLLNKSDLPCVVHRNELDSFAKGFSFLQFSSKTAEHLDELESLLVGSVKRRGLDFQQDDYALLNVRQKNVVEKALSSVQQAVESFHRNLSQEFVSAELRVSLGLLGELIGDVSNEDILGNIFSNFCIGK